MDVRMTFWLSLSCALPLLVFVLMNRRVDKQYHPLVLIFLVSLIVELSLEVNRTFFHFREWNYYAYSIATLVWLTLYLQFYRNIGILRSVRMNSVIIMLYLFLGMLNWSLWYKSEGFFNFFRLALLYSSIILVFSVELFSKQVFSRSKQIMHNPLFLVALAGVFFHVFFIFTVTLLLLRTSDGTFMNRVFDIQKIVNVLCYVIYAIAVLCMPKTKNYLL
jgi:hypothetical protein